MTSRPRSASPQLFVGAPRCGSNCDKSGDRAACSYRVAWSINPHMRVGSTQSPRAAWQHARFVRALAGAGAETVALPFVHGAFDSVFAKDNGVIVARDGVTHVLLAHPKHAVRRSEQGQRRAAFAAAGARIHDAPKAHFEGGDVVMMPGATAALMGHGFRSERAATTSLGHFLQGRVTPIELRDDRLYHLDMAVTVLTDGTTLVCRDALTPASFAALRHVDGVTDIVEVSLAEALGFGANLVQVGDVIVTGATAPRLQVLLEARGFRVARVRLDEFHAAGGSAACLVSRVHEQRRAERACSAA